MRSLALLFIFLTLGCTHGPPVTGPSLLIKDETARERFMMVQMASGQLSYKKIYHNLNRLNEMHPNEPIIQITRAGVYGDLGHTKDPLEEKKYKQQALQWLQPFVDKKYKDPFAPERIMALNQYYFHSGQFKELYEYGKRAMAQQAQGSEALVALGGSMYALQLEELNNPSQSKRLASEAKMQWEKLFDLSNSQMRRAINSNHYYISSVALTGQCERAQSLFDRNLRNTKRYRELERWIQKFNPSQIKSCQSQRVLSGE